MTFLIQEQAVRECFTKEWGFREKGKCSQDTAIRTAQSVVRVVVKTEAKLEESLKARMQEKNKPDVRQ